jgi:CPA1 family monovalent cation:H+ antiporter
VAACAHLSSAAGADPAPSTPDGCTECLQIGSGWVHLRRCLECGHIGCCDSSPNRHASALYAGTHHPVIQSFEPGETWRWCFVDEVVG